MNNDFYGFVICYGGYSDWKREYVYTDSVLAPTLQEAVSAIESWHNYNNRRNANLIVNDASMEALKLFYDNQHLCSKHDHQYSLAFKTNNVELATSNCGAWRVCLSTARAATLEEHEAIIKAEYEERKRERIAKAQEEKNKCLEKMNTIRRGWYSIFLSFECLEWNERRGGMINTQKEFTAQCIADSQMDAYNKACKDVKLKHPELDIWEFPDPTNQNYFYASFLGMKTDDGYSVKAWEEAKENGEI